MVGLRVLPTETLVDASGVLLVVASAEEKAKRVESYLRNNGHPLRTAWVSGLRELEDILQRNPPDLILCEDDNPTATLPAVLELTRRHAPKVPILALRNKVSAALTAQLLTEGVQDCVSASDPDHLRHLEQVVVRELINHHHQRELEFTRHRLQEFQSRHQQLTEGTVDAVAQVQEGILINANPAFAALLGYDNVDQLVGTPLIDLIVAPQQGQVKERLRQVLKGKHNGEPLPLSLCASNGQVDVKARLILGSDEGESIIEMLIRNENVDPDAASLRGEHAGFSTFSSALRQAKQLGGLWTAVLIRLDHFAEMENQIGVVAAEEIGNRVAQAVARHLQAQDQLFRISGSDIAVVAHRTDIEGLELLKQGLSGEVSGQVYTAGNHEQKISLTAVFCPLQESDDAETAIQQIVQETRRISESGGNRALIIGSLAATRVADWETTQLVEDTRSALQENQLNLAFQAIASLEGKANNLFDVTLRLVDRTGREREGSEFFHLAEDAGLATALDQWVISNVLTLLTEDGNDQVLFVKLSESTVRDAHRFAEWFASCIEESKLPPERLVIELQEGVAQRHIQSCKVIAQVLQSHGCQLALEHYGMGASSLRIVDDLPINYLKFDSQFTRNFADGEIQRRFKEGMEVAKHREIKTIVSYVEDNSLMAHLWQLGVNFVQGFHVQNPEVVLLSGPDTPHRYN